MTSAHNDKALILLVEDDDAVRRLITCALELNNYRILCAKTGQAGIMEAVSNQPDLILLDLGLPDIDGLELIDRVRGWSSVPIIVISARVEDTDKIGALDAGADDYLTKPFSVDEMLARVRVALRRTKTALEGSESGGGDAIFSNGPLRLDYGAGIASVKGAELHLTPTEYRLLVLLAKNCGRVLTHAYITREIWGTSWEGDVASLRVYMAALRKKIERADEANQKLIQTHVGVGYRMVRIESED
ncbi:response regulator transcription factor [Collinsella sp. AGMB00827]|uniref:Response regulator transcription factor n=1 Tax=Collinsella ureilytica TaxID=2869515 RepID=A0ABS7ML96_9ACTN|nr:response regulator transcription factor [Collinsella urealyticum]MBY4798135.1 response regulator transcription factor [Collinsella urealyticum]